MKRQKHVQIILSLALSLFISSMSRAGTLIAQWKMDDNAANATVLDSVGGRNGTFSDVGGDPHTGFHHSSDCREGTGSLAFDGVDDYVEIVGYQGITGTHSRTCSAWIKTSQSNAGEIISWGTDSPGQKWSVNVGSGTIRVFIYTGNAFGTTRIDDGQWHHIAVVLDDDGSPNTNEIKFYIDGVQDTLSSSSSYAVNTGDFYNVKLGAWSGIYGGFFKGLLDDVRIYDYALSAEDVHLLYDPKNAWNPSPASGAGKTIHGDLSWSAGEGAVSHDVYFGFSQAAVDSAQRLLGDINGDGLVNITDLAILASQWQTNPGAVNPSADIEYNQKVDFEDFASMASNWGHTSATEFMGNQTVSTFDPGTLAKDTNYYWRVDEVNPTDALSPWKGRVWNFTTAVATGRQTHYELTTGRRYVLYVPTDYNPSLSYPLVVSSHGTNQNGDTEMDSTGTNIGWDNGTPTWPVLAEQNDVIVVCPDMTGAYGKSSGAGSPEHAVHLAADETAVLAIINAIEAVYNIDSSRILMTGFSGGGHPTHYIGLRHPEVFRALCARHGNFLATLVPDPLPSGVLTIPVYIFTGSNDPTWGPSESIEWYTEQGFLYLDTDLFTTYPSNQHTTDRHHAMSWFASLTILPSL